ncbi:MAG TPA: hypothetical protein PK987_00945 [Ferruginibacter sp.]|nr:hypothetical protein [Ferruginibacter sp.]
MPKRIFIAFAIIVCIASCKSKDAFNYSQDFVKKEKSLLPDITKTEENVKRYMDKEQYDSIAIAGEKMVELINSKIKEVRNEPAPDAKEAENFKEACVRYFEFIKSMYIGYENYGKASTKEQRETAMTNLVDITIKKKDAINAIQLAQQKYADANGFRLESFKK